LEKGASLPGKRDPPKKVGSFTTKRSPCRKVEWEREKKKRYAFREGGEKESHIFLIQIKVNRRG